LAELDFDCRTTTTAKAFVTAKDTQVVEKVRDIVGLYMNPPDRAIVLCVDEKSQVQALNRTQPICHWRRVFRRGG
jgi:hypothetical protein